MSKIVAWDRISPRVVFSDAPCLRKKQNRPLWGKRIPPGRHEPGRGFVFRSGSAPAEWGQAQDTPENREKTPATYDHAACHNSMIAQAAGRS